MKLVVLLLTAILAFPAAAAYRVYKLKVEYYNNEGKLDRSEEVLSTLDPRQYEHYHGGFRTSKVTFVDTWYCPGDTGSYRRYCDPPVIKGEGDQQDRAPASVTPAKSSPLPYNRQPVIP